MGECKESTCLGSCSAEPNLLQSHFHFTFPLHPQRQAHPMETARHLPPAPHCPPFHCLLPPSISPHREEDGWMGDFRKGRLPIGPGPASTLLLPRRASWVLESTVNRAFDQARLLSMRTLSSRCPINSGGASEIKWLLYASSQAKETHFPKPRLILPADTAREPTPRAGRMGVSRNTHRNPELGNEPGVSVAPCTRLCFQRS